MCFSPRSVLRLIGCFAWFGFLEISGCAHTPSADDALDAALAQSGQTRQQVFPFAGAVTIDGHVAQLERRQVLVVTLFDEGKPDLQPHQRPHVECEEDGKFVFSTYKHGDGIPAGFYVVTIAGLKRTKQMGYLGPDVLNNLYNDPDKNAATPGFKIEHKAAKTDYVFNLKIQGVEPASAGSHAVTKIEP